MAKNDKKAATQEKEPSSSEIVRKFKQNPALFIGTVVVLVLVTVSFVLVPAIVPENRGNLDLTFGYYNKVPVSWVPGNFFSQAQENVTRNLRRHYEQNGSSDAFDLNNPYIQSYIWRQAFESAAVHTAVLHEMKRSKYMVPVKTVDKAVAMLPQFQHNGRFSSSLYNQMSDTDRLVLWRQVQDELIKFQYYNDIYGLITPSGEKDFFADMSSVMRSFRMVAFLVDDYPDSEYRAYAAENEALFGSIHLSRIVISSSEKEAARILNSIKDGTSTFEDTARSQSQDTYADRGGDMGARYVYELEQEITNSADREKILSLAKGEYSDVIRFNNMWAFYKVHEELKKPDFDDAAVMERLRWYVRTFPRGRMEEWAITQAREFIANAEISGFSGAASMIGKEVHEFGPLPLNYGSVDLFAAIEYFEIPGLSSQEISGLSQNEKFWETAFSTELNTPTEPVVQGSKVLVFFPDSQIDTDDEQLDMVRNMYSDWVNYTTERIFSAYFFSSPKMEDNFWDTYDRFFKPEL